MGKWSIDTIKASFPGGSVVKNPPASAGDVGLLPGLGRPPEKEMATHSSILAWKSPWTGEPGGLQPAGSQRAGHDGTCTHTHKALRCFTHLRCWQGKLKITVRRIELI